jgi:simple sugar transport system ATP-binding protein
MSALVLKNISKTFGTCRSNHMINMTIFDNEVHAILGENGAGKSTLMQIIYGHYTPDSGGEIFLHGKKTSIDSSAKAIKLGIGMVHQHFKLIKPFTILQNIILGVEPKSIFGTINYKQARQEVTRLLEKFRFELDLDQKVENCSVGTQQRVEIVKTLYRNANIIILDEPTAVLTPQEIEEFYQVIRNLKASGKTIIIITHKLHEIKEIADRCTIIRKGEFIETVDVASTSEAELASKMVGRNVDLKVHKNKAVVADAHKYLFTVKNLNVLNNKNLPIVTDFNLSIRAGEITGLAGIDGNGQSELVEALTGLRKVESGSVTIHDKEITNKTPLEIYHHRLANIPEDRQCRGLVMDFQVKENFVLHKIDSKPFSQYGFIINHEMTKIADNLINRFDIRPADSEMLAKNLSGGNQQKIILAREIDSNPEVLIAFQPTRGLDVGAIEYIHRQLVELRDAGKAILLISYELDEIINLSDRIAVIYDGKITADLESTTLQNTKNLKQDIGFFMAGGSSSI